MVWISWNARSKTENGKICNEKTKSDGTDGFLGPLSLEIVLKKNYFISCEDGCSRKKASKWTDRKRSIDVLDVLEDYIIENGKPENVMHDNGR